MLPLLHIGDIADDKGVAEQSAEFYLPSVSKNIAALLL
jgi:hypothetical protein